MKFIFSVLVFTSLSQLTHAVVIGECKSPKVQLIQAVAGSPYHVLTLSEEAKKVFRNYGIPFHKDYSDISNFSTYIPGSQTPQSNCILWTNMIRLRTEYTLDMCGNDWILKAHIWKKFHIGERDFQVTLKNCR